MTKLLALALFFFFTTIITAQNEVEKELMTIVNSDEAKNYLTSNSNKDTKIIVFNEEKHKTALAEELFKASKGVIKTVKNEHEKIYYKVIEKTQTPYYRVRYIYLDGNKLSVKNINSLREKIIKKHENGAPFDFLAQQYSMDENANKGGDSGWFKVGDNLFDFEKIITLGNRQVEDIYIVDSSKTKAYYIILQSYEPKNISEIKVLKIVEAIN
jgi:parvulin-like peptidyl-prolyl isomerase